MSKTPAHHQKQIVYAGFFTRIFASLIDCFFSFFLLLPITNLMGRFIYRDAIHPAIFFNKVFPQLHEKGTPLTQILYDYLIVQHTIYNIILDQTFQFLVLGIMILFFWIKKQATPGKLIMRIKVLDEKTLKPLPTNRLIIRFLAYIVSALPLGLGFVMIGLNKYKKGLHDTIAGSIVVRS